MSKPAQNIRILFMCAAFFGLRAAQAGIDATYTGHDSVSVTSALTVSEQHSVNFGNFTVGSPGDNGASIAMSDTGTRTVSNTLATTITLLNGGVSDLGSQGPGFYQVAGATANTNLYGNFTDIGGTAISAANPVVLTGPVGSGTFDVDTMTFNQSGSDVNGPYITSDGSGSATIQVGATLHTVTGVSTYAPGQYRGTFELIVGY